MLGRTDSRGRLLFLLVAFALLAGVLGVRLAYWQVGEGPQLRRLAEAQIARANPPAPAERVRGDITDRNGTLLATTAYRDFLAAYPDTIAADRRGAVAERLAGILGLGRLRTAQLVDSFERGVPYVVIARRLTEEQSQAVRRDLAAGELAGLALEPRAVRFYPNAGGAPNTSLASQLIGFVSEDGQGRYGVEQHSDQRLSSQHGPTAALDGGLPMTDAGLALTIDASLQLRLEKDLYATWVADRASRVSAVVMDARTGAILAWGSVPGYDANDYAAAATDPSIFIDPLAGELYEPGSVLKTVTAAAALEAGKVGLSTPVLDAKSLQVGSNVVYNADRKQMGEIPFEDVIAFSRNVAVGKVAMMLGRTTDQAAGVLYSMWQRLGLGHRTGVDVAGEVAGLASDPQARSWQPIDLINRSFGQGVAVTPLQLAVAYAAMVNGGNLITPHVELRAAPADPAEVLDERLSARLRQLLVHAVNSGPRYQRQAQIPGYLVGGKTGTAQIWDARRGAWKEDVFNHTFCGFVGGDEPELVIVVRIHDAAPLIEESWGMSLEVTSSELFRRIAQNAIEVLDIPPAGGSVEP